MVETSRPWSGTAPGDASPSSDDLWTDIWATFLGPNVGTEGVFFEQLNELVLTGAASPVSIASGRALVDGQWYQSTAAVTQAIATPAGGVNSRIDLVVLRKDWVLKTTRIATIAGGEAVNPVPPVPVQNDGVTWDLPLWEVHIIHTTGIITIFRDRREFLGQYEPAGYPTLTRVYLDDDFFEGNGAFVDGESRRFWTYSVPAGAGNGIAILNIAGFTKGAIRLSHGALSAGDFIGVNSGNYRPSQMDGRLLMTLKEPNTDTDLDRVAGFVSAANTLTPNDGVFFRNQGTVDANWHAATFAGGAFTDTDTGVALGDTFKDLEIRVRTGVVEFLIDTVIVATHVTNVPSDVNKLLSIGVFDDGANPPASAVYQDIDFVKVSGNV